MAQLEISNIDAMIDYLRLQLPDDIELYFHSFYIGEDGGWVFRTKHWWNRQQVNFNPYDNSIYVLDTKSVELAKRLKNLFINIDVKTSNIKVYRKYYGEE